MTDEEVEKWLDEAYDELDRQEFEMEEIGLIMHGDCSYYIQYPDEYEKDKKICELENEVMRLEHRLANCIELPVKIGDKIYVIPSETNYKINIINKHEERNKVYEFIVNEIRYNQYGYSVVSWVDNIPFFFLNGDKKAICECFETERFYNETWFITKEEAKAKLRSLKDGCDRT